ncbi:hypothetical protein C0Q70_06354 [Pomacea canaliculata]|uniref:Helicase ATP-binding domain-containing protein n=1 Tax=Pomacea canaliculata TaxID=400727 RepID=A0A2T7PNS4_POMCA|nr:hypothetical protein C0Q70_06354 [Pomacea canaliculata]
MADNFEDDDDELFSVIVDEECGKETTTQKVAEKENFGDCSVPTTFPFPFEPYQIQTDFMRQLYICLQEGKVGIFESPTGTGKSLSLICGALTWLKDFQDNQRKELDAFLSESTKTNGYSQGGGGFDWVTEFSKRKEQEDRLSRAKQEQELIEQREKRLKNVQSSSKVTRGKRKFAQLEDDFSDLLKGSSIETQKAFNEDYESDEEKSAEWKENENDEDAHVTKNLCINEAVRKLKSVSFINDRCLELQQKKSKKNPGCPYRKQEILEDFRDRALLGLCDIEQLTTLGRETKTCPYYGSRLAIPSAEVVVLPYNTLLHKSTREASGVKLAGNVVIVDEAHNLLETVNSVHSVEVTGAQILRAHSQLSQYEVKYRSRLKAKNLMYVKQILFVLSNLVKCMGGKTGVPADKQNTGKSDVNLMTINNFLFEAKIDNLNLFKIRGILSPQSDQQEEKYQVAEVIPAMPVAVKETATFGVSMFLKNIGKAKTSDPIKEDITVDVVNRNKSTPVLNSPLMHIESFLQALTTANDDGRVVLSKQMLLSQSGIKFLLLNPAVHFADVLQEARAVVVAGGTMQPISEFKDQLFFAAGLQPDKLLEFSCGHVIPPDHLLSLTLATGPTGRQLDFTFQTRDDPHLLEELGRLVVNLCSVVPGGIVLFFPSYDYEQLVSVSWEKSGILGRIEAKKKIFREPKSAIQVEHVLTQYGDCIKKCQCRTTGGPTGAILMCVVGGKMSEGINFSDDLGRCVLMVGMPYPNLRSPELKEKIDYLNSNFPKDEAGRPAGQVHYENLCMKAINQSIGRAIRHREDYAVIILADQRYSRTSVSSKLPGWIAKHLYKMDAFPPALARVSKKEENDFQWWMLLLMFATDDFRDHL